MFIYQLKTVSEKSLSPDELSAWWEIAKNKPELARDIIQNIDNIEVEETQSDPSREVSMVIEIDYPSLERKKLAELAPKTVPKPTLEPAPEKKIETAPVVKKPEPKSAKAEAPVTVKNQSVAPYQPHRRIILPLNEFKRMDFDKVHDFEGGFFGIATKKIVHVRFSRKQELISIMRELTQKYSDLKFKFDSTAPQMLRPSAMDAQIYETFLKRHDSELKFPVYRPGKPNPHLIQIAKKILETFPKVKLKYLILKIGDKWGWLNLTKPSEAPQIISDKQMMSRQPEGVLLVMMEKSKSKPSKR